MKTIYKAVAARIATTVPAMAWVDYDRGQLNVKPGERPALKLPATLLRIEIPTAKDITDKSQSCRVRITVRMIFETIKPETATAFDESKMDKSLEPYDVISDVYKSLQGFENENFGPLSRIKSTDENRTDGLFVYQHVFEGDFEDDTSE